jgi:Ca2+-transporting ATPase
MSDRENIVPWSKLAIGEISQRLGVDLEKGLSEEQILSHRRKYGPNIIKKEERFVVLKRFLKQLKSPLIIVLIIAAIVTFLLQEFSDSLVISLALGINVFIGFFQENRADKAFEKLNNSQTRKTNVIRDSKVHVVNTEDVVVGDIVRLDTGSFIPADLRLFEAGNFSVNESILTGEWASVSKDVEVIEKSKSIHDMNNMAWMGTLVSTGYGRGIVVETGERTEFGMIAKSLSGKDSIETPIQKSIRKLARFLVYTIISSVVLIFALGVFRGQPMVEMLLLSIAVAVSVIPEGLPAAVTAVLAIGMERILKAGGLVRNLLAAETLGSTTVILTDKTGTLTEAKMTVASLLPLSFILGGEDRGDNHKLLETSMKSVDAFVDGDVIQGNPVEKALVEKSLKLNIEIGDRRKDFLPFDSKNRFSASIYEDTLYLNGAPEELLSHSEYVFVDGKEREMSQEERQEFIDKQEAESRQGKRLIAVAYKRISWESISENMKDLERGLVFVGLISFEDPIRDDVYQSIQTAKDAGARVIMITGDHKDTALYIASQAGISKQGDIALEGKDLDGLSDKELLQTLKEVHVFARILPTQKLRIAKILRKSGEVVSMTGDGINDSPALKNADIGVALGSGSEVAKEASDLVLINNSFTIIVKAIEEGRRIIDNIKKIVAALLSTNFSELIVIVGSLLFGVPLPILPGQILWINIVEDSLLNFAFAFEPKEDGLMKRSPKSKEAGSILTFKTKRLVVIVSSVTAVFSLILYLILYKSGLPIKEIRTIMFVALSLDTIFAIMAFKNIHKPIWKINVFSNKYLIFSLIVSFLTLLIALVIPFLRDLLHLTVLVWWEIILLLGLGIFNLFIIEVVKYFVFVRNK